jgi:hypothetical protein
MKDDPLVIVLVRVVLKGFIVVDIVVSVKVVCSTKSELWLIINVTVDDYR